MTNLGPFALPPRAGAAAPPGLTAFELIDHQSQQRLVIRSQKPLAMFDLERGNGNCWQQKSHPDGVVIGEARGKTWVCFVELKSSTKKKAFQQIEKAVRHFHPEGRGTRARKHGAEHHDHWVSRKDRLPFLPSANHPVVGLCVVNGNGTRGLPTGGMMVRGTRIPFRFVQFNSRTPRVEPTFDDLLRKAGL
ncbi:MAG: hypothetical protein ACYDCL_17440 [Myxococcales bacterium]